MKTLTELKTNAERFEWMMIKNSWAKEIRPELSAFREVACVRKRDIGFYTEKFGVTSISYCDWPKARNVKINTGNYVYPDGFIEPGYLVVFNGEEASDCTITYFLKHK